ncbi:hypothetical protein TraAM80_04137 [Trypanosoma rangeli]|uniref:Nodulin-like domain-containing protein n=1 Tax=Trypanosoma rangeli TaxID=5698 RepID=A0A422NL17_TRYRA|nr:uncharacterized protein TraAM80_04137 [Trypanosoma rangeli]RNF06155.1 hypothetical protein TraAM80_04137 [Trypanosoma rangeli]|eukprot:RNF06155.1 hypothetical protein TraAM80_04137 [Trypanosoma rangeli]
MSDLPPLQTLHSRVVFATPRESGLPLERPSQERQQNRSATGKQSENIDDLLNSEAPIILIDQHKISDFMRFRMVFIGMLLFINSSTQGLHALFAIYMENKYGYDVRTMVNIYAAGTAFGLFVFPFGVMYDFFGPRIVVGVATVITALGHLLFGLTFAEHIKASETRFCIFFALMNWGCYAFDVAALPAVLTYTPRDRAQPAGLLKTFSALGSSLISCIFRGFFNNHFDNLMYFLTVLVLVFGVIGTVCISDAPYRINRWESSRITLRDRLKRYLVRNRYMSQLMPKRRFAVLSVVLLVMNVYLSIQAICAAYYRKQMTVEQYRGLAIGAILIVLCILFLVVPLHSIDGDTLQDETVLQRANEKARELEERRLFFSKRTNKGADDGCEEAAEEEHTQQQEEGGHGASEAVEVNDPSLDALDPPLRRASGPAVPYGESSEYEGEKKNTDDKNDGANSEYLTVEVEANLIEAENLIIMENASENGPQLTQRWLNNSSIATNMRPSNIPSGGEEDEPDTAGMDVLTRQVSTYNRPYVETITVCGEVFVTPIYETTFLQSLTYVDLWLLWYTVFVVWGVGMAMTANWNIQAMVATVFRGLDYETYVLFATMSGISTAFGRVSIGTFEILLVYFSKKTGVLLPATVALPFPSAVLALALIFYLSFPGNYSLTVVYMIAGCAYGFSTSLTIYIIGIIFRHDIGMHYGFCWFGASLGIVLLYRVLFFHVYDEHKIVLPPNAPIKLHGRCTGRKCLQITLIVYLILAISSVGTSYWLHHRYWKLVRGKLKYKRVITHFVKKRFRRINEMKKKDGANGG